MHALAAVTKAFFGRFAVQSVGAVLLTALSLFLILRHAELIHGMNGSALPLAASVVPLEERLAILKEQVAIAERSDAVRMDSPEERLRVFVLPESPDLPRLLSLFETVGNLLGKKKLLRTFSPIDLSEVPADTGIDGLKSTTITFDLTTSREGFDLFSRTLDLAGFLTVSDALTPEELARLLTETEKENPAGLASLEQFLSLDLLSYARDAKAYDERLLKSYNSESFAALFAHLRESSALHSAIEILAGDIGTALAPGRLWPLPFVMIEKATVTEQSDGWLGVSLTLTHFTRTK